MKNKIFTYIFSIALVQIVGFLGTFFTNPSIDTWYAALIKPSFNPPNWVFGPVWTTLFLLIGIALGAVIDAPKANKYRRTALIVFAVQLFLNLGWSFVFFYLQQPGWAVVEIILLIISIILNIYYASKVKRGTGWLLAPYIFWVSFATILNIAIWRLNA